VLQWVYVVDAMQALAILICLITSHNGYYVKLYNLCVIKVSYKSAFKNSMIDVLPIVLLLYYLLINTLLHVALYYHPYRA